MTLSDYLAEKSLKPSQFAEEVPCEPSTITRIIKGERGASLGLALRIEEITGGMVTPRDLMPVADPSKTACG